MFNFLKKKTKLHSPVDGVGLPIENVKDAVFAQKMLGDGFAVTPESEYICSPCDGKLVQVFPTNHAFGIMTEDQLEVLVHIGIDTVELKGEHFTRLKEVGETIKMGDKIVKIDLKALKDKNIDTDIMVVITNMDKVSKIQSSITNYKVGDKVAEITLT